MNESIFEARGSDIYFSDIFKVSTKDLEDYGAFNISPIVDMPLFIDPFLLFASKDPTYQKLHQEIIKYLRYLKDISTHQINRGLLKDLYCFKEVHQNCLGFCLSGIKGSGLGLGFAKALKENLHNLFEATEEKITQSSHLEKLTLIRAGVGRDNISDFTTNLIKGFLLEYTEKFAKEKINPSLCREVNVSKVAFNYKLGFWGSKLFTLPYFNRDYILLTPENLLTKDENWINKEDLHRDFARIKDSLPNEVLRAQVDQYLTKVLPRDAKANDIKEATNQALLKFPILIDYFISDKEAHSAEAVSKSQQKVKSTYQLLVGNLSSLISKLNKTLFYKKNEGTRPEVLNRINFLKQVIEQQDGYRLFYDKDGKIIAREKDVQIAFKLVWAATISSVDSEVNNGRGPVDFKVSRGKDDCTLVEFKLASNPQLERNLQNQVEIYKKANNTKQAFTVIIFFTKQELAKIEKILRKISPEIKENLILIDARRDNKKSASKA